MTQTRIGILGGSGLYQMDALTNPKEHRLNTPYGDPSDAVITGELNGVPVAFLARHGRGHRLLPGEVPYAANIFALKSLGVRYLLSFSAVGSLKEEVAPLDMLLPDQYIDMTRQRRNTFFGGGAVAHVSMAQPVCPALRGLLADAVQATDRDIKFHRSGTYVCMEGPQFSSLAESHWYRSMNADVIGMTNMPEAKLAREAQIAYASLSMVTDYDCWHPKEEHVNADMALQNLMQNADRAQRIALNAIELIANAQPDSIAHTALQQSLVTPQDAMTDSVREAVEVLLR